MRIQVAGKDRGVIVYLEGKEWPSSVYPFAGSRYWVRRPLHCEKDHPLIVEPDDGKHRNASFVDRVRIVSTAFNEDGNDVAVLVYDPHCDWEGTTEIMFLCKVHLEAARNRLEVAKNHGPGPL